MDKMNETNQTRPRCDSCHFWMKMEGSSEGRCHRYPPVPYSAMHSAFPETYSSMWCGEWKVREVVKPIPNGSDVVPVPAQVIPSKGKRR